MGDDTSSTDDAGWHVSRCDRWTRMDPQSLYAKLFLLTLMPTPANVIDMVCVQ